MIAIEVKNPLELAVREKGEAVRALDRVAHELLVDQVDGAIRDQLADALAKQGVQAVVSVVRTAPAASSGGFGAGHLVIAAAAGLVLGALVVAVA